MDWSESPLHYVSVSFILTSHPEFAGQRAGHADTPERAAAINEHNWYWLNDSTSYLNDDIEVSS